MNRTKLIVMAVLFAILLLITATLVAAQTSVGFNYATAVPDGNEGEWDTRLPTSTPPNLDWVTSTCATGIPCSNPTGDLFIRFDANAPQTNKPNHGTVFILWLARSGGTYTADPSTCGTACNNFVDVAGYRLNDSSTYLYPGRQYPGKDVWAQLTDGKGWEAAVIEIECDLKQTWIFQSTVNGQTSTTGSVDLTPRCIGMDSTHGPTGPAGSITNDSVTIASTLTSRPTGTVTWYYCYDGATTIPPSSTFPNGCLPNDPLLRFVSTPIGSTPITKLNTPPPPMRVAWNTSRAGAIPILLGPLLAPLGAFNPNTTVTTVSPNFTPPQMGTYCYYATYAPSTTAQGAGYSAMAHTNNSTECFIISLPTAVSISSMTAQAGWPSANLPLLFGLLAGAVATIGAGVVGIGKLLRMF